MALYYIFKDGKILMRRGGRPFPNSDEVRGLESLFEASGVLDRKNPSGDRWAVLPSGAAVPDWLEQVERRSVWQILGERQFRRVGKAFHLSDWQRTRRYCGVCGAQTELDEGEWAMICRSCGEIYYPVIAPAMIVAVERDGKLLLGHGANFPPGRYSVLAGFVEPGENLEECVKREVNEECGINIKNVTYFGSQMWPFPRSLMVGFTAEWESGEIEVDNEEMLQADWFSVSNLPDIPENISISWRLIDNFVKKHS